MRTAPPEALLTDVRPVMTAHISPLELERFFPVDFVDVDPLAAAEPSRAALLRLETGGLVVVEYGLVTCTLTVSVPRDRDFDETLAELFLEVPIPSSAIEWLAAEARTAQGRT